MTGFVAGTLVHTEKGLVPIQEIKVGDMVLSRPEWGSKDAPTEYKYVSRVFCSGEDELIRVSCQRDSEYDDTDAPIYIEFITSNHPIWDESLKEWIPASEIEIGTLLSSIDNEDNLRVLSIEYVYKGYINNNILIGGCFDISFGNEDGQELDMLIQFNNDNYLIHFNQYNESYSVDKDKYIKLEQDLVGKVADGCYGFDRLKLKVQVYNLEIEDHPTYFVGHDGIWVNC